MEHRKAHVQWTLGRHRPLAPGAAVDKLRDLALRTAAAKGDDLRAGELADRVIACAAGTAALLDAEPACAEPADVGRREHPGPGTAAREAELERRIARLQAEKEAAERRLQQLTELFEATPIALLAIGRDGRIRLANRLAQRLLDVAADELTGSHLAELVPEAPAGITETLLDASAQPHPATIAEFPRATTTVVDAGDDAGVRWLRLDAARGACGQNIVCALSDITVGKDIQRRADEALQTVCTALNVVDAGVVVTDAENRIAMVNPAFTTITGYGADEVLGLNPRVLASGSQDEAFYRRLWERITTTGSWHGEIVNRHKSGRLITVWQSISVVRDEAGNVIHYVAVFNDISARRRVEASLKKRAQRDPLTHLPSRSLILDRIGQALARARRERQRMAVLYVAIDDFKQRVGQRDDGFGEALLQQVVHRLIAGIRDSDTLARLRDGEFVILLPRIGAERDAATVARKFLGFLAHPFELDGEVMHLSASIGFSVFPEHGYRKMTLLRNAHRAMHSGWRAGGSRVTSASGLAVVPGRPGRE